MKFTLLFLVIHKFKPVTKCNGLKTIRYQSVTNRQMKNSNDAMQIAQGEGELFLERGEE